MVATWLAVGMLVSAAPGAPAGGGADTEQALPVDLAVTGGGALVWLLSEAALKPVLAPPHCRLCDEPLNGVDAWGRGVRAPAIAGQRTADTVSGVLAYGAVPGAVLASGAWVLHQNAAFRRAGEDVLDVAEAVVLAGLLNQSVKFAVGRERPFVHALLPGQTQTRFEALDDNVSFYSGHTSAAFSLVVAAGTVASERGYEGAALIWGVGLPLAAAVPVLRMVADKHYLTDVLAGAALGGAVGFAVPTLLHPRRRPARGATGLASLQLGVTGNGALLRGCF